MKVFKYSLSLLLVHVVVSVNAQNKSEWIYAGKSGKLNYKTMDRGDKIMDFSYAGYMGGGVSIPTVPVKVILNPLDGDNTEAIQNAILQVSKMPLVNGLRGAILLNKGTYSCSGQININNSGVVLRGSGSGGDGTIINMIGTAHLCISVKGNVNSTTLGNTAKITDAYVPSGSNSFSLDNASGFSVGDTIRITRPVTDEWVKFMGMDALTRDGKKQTWIKGDITIDRVISKIDGKKIALDVPLTDSYDAIYTKPGVSVVKIKTTGEISQTGVESLRITCMAKSVTINDAHYRALSMSGLSDGWAKDIDIYNTVNSVSVTGKCITLDGVNINHTIPTVGAAKPADLNGSGPQILFNHCNITGDNVFFLATGAKVSGPIVLLNCVFKGNGWIQPHQRWATGLLIDNCQVPNGGIDFMNRGAMGSGHGWAIGWAVAWNCIAKSFLNQQPPGAVNWVIGSNGESQKKPIPSFPADAGAANQPEGIYDSKGTSVTPASLYLSQLAERLGKQAVKNIGY
ncbi:MAG: hypothetical protein ABIN91_03205 [Mucilaginibacter sp.]|uniref:hypothetical protein n=1 Tax=Mucilaginibacter sp. TaxID=1882438 RepID=UPI0032635C1F